ncbi:MAG TPA: diguanylate cyclase, partial [Chroococcales cyanobacterium]
REFARYQKNDVSLAMVVFEVVAQRGGEIFELPQESLNSVANCIRSACSPLDIVAYVGGTEFAVLLASTDGAGALDFAASLNETLQQFELPQFPGATLLAAFGVGSIPETCTHPEVLVTAARQAKEMAKSMPEPYCLFPA